MTAHFARPADFEWPSKLDRAISAGFAPHPDDNLPPAEHLLPGAGVDPLTAFAAQVNAVRANNERTWVA